MDIWEVPVSVQVHGTIAINKLDLWVQLHGMYLGFMSQRVVKDIGNYIGNFVE